MEAANGMVTRKQLLKAVSHGATFPSASLSTLGEKLSSGIGMGDGRTPLLWRWELGEEREEGYTCPR